MAAERARPVHRLGHDTGKPDVKLLTVDEVAILLRTSRKAVYAMVERRQLAGVRRIGRRVLIDRDELLHWLDHTCASSPRE
jgi:excisionase family DNA binding protein